MYLQSLPDLWMNPNQQYAHHLSKDTQILKLILRNDELQCSALQNADSEGKPVNRRVKVFFHILDLLTGYQVKDTNYT